MRRIIKGHRMYIPKAESPLVLWLKEFKSKESDCIYVLSESTELGVQDCEADPIERDDALTTILM